VLVLHTHTVSLHACHNMLAGSTGCAEWEAGLALSEALINHPHLVKGEDWPKPYIHTYIQCIHGTFGRESTIHTVIYGVHIRIYGSGQPYKR